MQLAHARRLLNDLYDALHPPRSDNNEVRPSIVWRRETFDPLRTNDDTRGFSISKELLTNVAAEYLARPELQSDYFDWLLLDALIFMELDAFGNHVVNVKGGTGFNWGSTLANGSQAQYIAFSFLFGLIGFGIRYVAPAILILYLLDKKYTTLASGIAVAWVGYLALLLFTYPARWRTRRKAKKLLQHLLDVYEKVGGETISPRKLKETLDQAVAEGVVLDGAVFGIVDRMIARDPAVFLPNHAG